MRKHIMNTSASRMRSAMLAALLIAGAGSAGAQTVSQTPLSVAGGVPGNLIFTPSVEWPTVDSLANIATTYVVANTYVGYFDSDKCYNYSFNAAEPLRHFYPVSMSVGHTCSGALKQWSGNFLNWAATQTIDPFRKALTGGYRTTDTPTVTILEKARSDANTAAGISLIAICRRQRPSSCRHRLRRRPGSRSIPACVPSATGCALPARAISTMRRLPTIPRRTP